MDNNAKIIKHGRCYNRVVRFECKCGCVFETNDIDQRLVWETSVSYYTFCPECGNRCRADDYDRMEVQDGKDQGATEASPPSA